MNKQVITICKWIGIGALVIAPFALRYVDTSLFFPFITGKNFFWRFFIEIAFVAWAACALLSAQYRINWKHPFALALISFMGIILLANTFGNSPYLSFWSTAERMDGYISLLHLAAYFIVLVGLLRTRVNLERMMIFLLVFGLYIATIGWAEELKRIDSTLGNPIYLASLSFFGVFISGYFLVAKEKLFSLPQVLRVTIFGALAVAFFYTIFRTGTRGALLGVVGGGATTALLMTFLVREQSDKVWRYLAGGAVILTLIAGGIFFGAREQVSQVEFVQENVLLSRLVRISPEDRTTGFRLANWNMALEGWKERPLLGWGQEGYAEVFSEYYDVENLYNAEQWYDRVHNTFLDWLVFGGILGFLAYCGIFVVLLYLLWKRSSFHVLQKCVLTGLLVGYLFQNLVAFDSLTSGIYLYATFALLFVTSPDQENTTPQDVSGEKTFSYLIIAGLIIVTGFWMHYSIYQPRAAAKSFVTFVQTLRNPQLPPATNAERSLRELTPLLENETFLNGELAMQLIQQRQHILVPGISTESLRNYFLQVSETAVHSFQRYNNPTKLTYLYGVFLTDLGVYEGAAEHLDAALEKSPRKLNIVWHRAILAEKMGDISQARKLYEQAVTTTPPNFIQAQQLYNEFLKRQKLTNE